jgi:hypothetical protein
VSGTLLEECNTILAQEIPSFVLLLMVVENSRNSHNYSIGLISSDRETHATLLTPYAPLRPLFQSQRDLFF